jgi:Trypsin
MRRVVAIALTALVVGCAPDMPEAPLDQVAQPIYLGGPATSDEATVAMTRSGQSFCSGTLITPTVVVTAAHCLPPNISGAYTDIAVFFGSKVGSGDYVPVVGGWTHPSWNDDALYFDVGLVRLAKTAPVAPIPFNVDGSVLVDAAPVRIVGFGITGEDMGGGGLKREGTAVIDDVDGHVLVLSGDPSGTCSGDSGGSSIMDVDGVDTLVGVHSRADCVGVSIEMRTDTYEAKILDFIGDPECQMDGICWLGCPFVDLDCPCAKDGFCTDECEDKSSDLDCPVPCIADNFCDATCDADPDCPCQADGLCESSCIEDPDCGCEADGHCADSCDAPDPDCEDANACLEDGVCGAGCADDPDCDEVTETPPLAADAGGCSASGQTPSDPAGPEAWWLLALLGCATRRRC